MRAPYHSRTALRMALLATSLVGPGAKASPDLETLLPAETEIAMLPCGNQGLSEGDNCELFLSLKHSEVCTVGRLKKDGEREYVCTIHMLIEPEH